MRLHLPMVLVGHGILQCLNEERGWLPVYSFRRRRGGYRYINCGSGLVVLG